MSELPTTTDALLLQLRRLLEACPEGIGEYALIQRLRSEAPELLPAAALGDRLVLFRSHFLLFNALYRLRDQLAGEQRAYLQISALDIRLQPWAPGEQALVEDDPLRRYYLDERHLLDTTEQEVGDLLASFWRRLQGGEEKAAALALFELEEPVDYPRIRQRYRQLVSRHHPDRGGSTDYVQSLNKGMEILARYYSRE
ncbi:MAG: hypothetical protein GAK45_01026 [Pseudomonas citronellolis]|nr:MAG: hypothetical protein GAK45_01026 [Pseudomonas citronellolis]